MKKVILPIIMSLFIVTTSSCQKEEDLSPQIVTDIQNPMRTILISNGDAYIPVENTPWDVVRSSNLTVRKGTLIKVRPFGCGIASWSPGNPNPHFSGPSSCTAIVTVIGVGDYSVTKSAVIYDTVDWTVP
jgi:hypothetical protein